MQSMTVSELITKRMADLYLSKTDVVKRMGYVKIAKGLKHLGEILDNSYLTDHQYAMLAKALEVEREVVIKAMLETHREEEARIERKRKDAFRPHICAMFEERVPSPIFIGNMVYHRRFAYFENFFLELPFEVQLAVVKEKIQQHHKCLKGYLSGFGKTLHYVLRRDFDEKSKDMIFFDLNGDVIENTHKTLQCYPGEPSGLLTRGQRLDHLLKLKNASGNA